MQYQSTRSKIEGISAAQAIARGLSQDGGLFVPEAMPSLTQNDIEKLIPLSYKERAAKIMGLFLDDFSAEELAEYTAAAYSSPSFDCDEVAPTRLFDSKTSFLEL